MVEYLFEGSALVAVRANGAVTLPGFIAAVIERRSDARALTLGAHETDPCMTGYDRGFSRLLFVESERRRAFEEAAGIAPPNHFARARRTFGAVEPAPIDEQNTIVLPPMLRRRGRIEALALFIGIGGSFEIWNPHLALESGDANLRELAEYRLGETNQQRGESE